MNSRTPEVITRPTMRIRCRGYTHELLLNETWRAAARSIYARWRRAGHDPDTARMFTVNGVIEQHWYWVQRRSGQYS